MDAIVRWESGSLHHVGLGGRSSTYLYAGESCAGKGGVLVTVGLA